LNFNLFGTKGQTLANLEKFGLSKSIILSGMLLKRTHLASIDFDSQCKKIFSDEELFAVRSSFVNEDSLFESNAGKFLSILNCSYQSLRVSALEVFNSNKFPHIDDEILIQPMLKSVTLSGVVLTYDRDTKNHYRIIEYSENGNTASVTSGASIDSITRIYWRDCFRNSRDIYLNSIGEMVEELEKILGTDKLDIEFAFQQGQPKPFLLQVRPLVDSSSIDSKTKSTSVDQYLPILERKLEGIFQQHPFLVGDTTILGVMPDWNPAEIIGIRPRPLALSLYRELITDGMWAYQRHNYGYRNLRSFPLMLDLGGQPYIDVRISFNSFIPEKLPSNIAHKLVNGYLEKLRNQPGLHDKVEFEIVTSSLNLDFDQKIDELKSYGLDQSEIGIFKESLKQITENVFTRENPRWKIDEQRIMLLESRREKILNSKLGHLDKIYWLLEDCKRYGTLPFGGLARAAFISTQLLNSFQSVGLIDTDQKNLVNKSIKTIASEISLLHKRGKREDFLNSFGHLRPGTYDITQLSYKEDPLMYFSNFNEDNMDYSDSNSQVDLKDIQINFEKITKYLEPIGFSTDAEETFNIIRETIKLRESSKLEFTKNLSCALDVLAEYGSLLGFNRNELSYLNFGAIKAAYLSGLDIKSFFRQEISQNVIEYEICKSLWLPPLIKSASDIYAFDLDNGLANFIGQDCVESRISIPTSNQNLEESIVLIENADPGFDWIFTSSIKGIITAYGGMNSHMAVRSGEFGLPCAIGVGQKKFNELKNANRIRLDCLNKMITILS
jgi:phosphohistidine swiveling domain-containing protein